MDADRLAEVLVIVAGDLGHLGLERVLAALYQGLEVADVGARVLERDIALLEGRDEAFHLLVDTSELCAETFGYIRGEDVPVDAAGAFVDVLDIEDGITASALAKQEKAVGHDIAAYGPGSRLLDRLIVEIDEGNRLLELDRRFPRPEEKIEDAIFEYFGDAEDAERAKDDGDPRGYGYARVNPDFHQRLLAITVE